jgi:hypothetical protein
VTALRGGLEGPARRIAAAGLATVVLLGLAVGVTVSRYGEAVNAGNAALEQSEVVVATEQGRTALARIGGLVDAYGGDKDPADLRDKQEADREVHAALGELRARSDDATGAQR